MKTETVRAFLDAADDLLAAQQQLMPQPLSQELRGLAEAYVAARRTLMEKASRHSPSRASAAR